VHGHVVLEERDITRERDPARDWVVETVGLCAGIVTNKDSWETARGEFRCALLLWDEFVCAASKDTKMRDVRYLAGPDALWKVATEGPVRAAVLDICKRLHGLSPERPRKTGVDEHGADRIGDGEVDALGTCVLLRCVGCCTFVPDAVLGEEGGESARDIFATIVGAQGLELALCLTL
jgi:hypothetical protein